MAQPPQHALDVSLEPHLLRALQPLAAALPPELASQLSACISPLLSDHASSHTQHTVPYALLASISRWSRSPQGHTALRAHSPPLHPEDYAMISLLAGTRTSPNRKFPDVIQQPSLASESRKQRSERRAITALLNSLLSILGSGAAAWWAAERLVWKDEWRALFALFVAAVIAASEAVLYLIWESRRSPTPRINRRLVPPRSAPDDQGADTGEDKKSQRTEGDGSISVVKSTALADQAVNLHIRDVSATVHSL